MNELVYPHERALGTDKMGQRGIDFYDSANRRPTSADFSETINAAQTNTQPTPCHSRYPMRTRSADESAWLSNGVSMDKSDVEYAGFWVRVGATLIDTLLIMVITFPLLVSIYGWKYFGSEKLIAGPADFLISWVLPAVAVVWFWTQKQATPGKAALSLRVLDADSGENLSIGQSIGRYFGYFISIIPLGLGLIWVGLDSKKQGWHDKLAHTVVVRAKNHGPEPVRFPQA